MASAAPALTVGAGQAWTWAAADEQPGGGQQYPVALADRAPWRDLPERYGNWNSVYRRFRRWSASGVWEAVSTCLADAMSDAAHHSIDSTTVRPSACFPTMLRIAGTLAGFAHVSAAGAKRGATDRRLAARGAGGDCQEFRVRAGG